MVLLLDSALSDVCQSDDTSGTAVSPHGQRHSADAEVLRLLETHVLAVVGITVTINEATAGSSHREIPQEAGTSQVDTVDLRSIIRIPTSDDVPSLQILLVVLFLEHPCSGLDMGQSPLFIDMGVDEVPDLMRGLLGLSCGSTPEHDDMIMHKIYLVCHSINSICSSCRCS